MDLKREKIGRNTKKERISIKLLGSYLAIILAPAVAILVIYITMQNALLDIQKEKAQNLSREAVINFNREIEQLVNVAKYIGGDGNLKNYVLDRENFSEGESFYKAFELANSYPDYAVLNRFIKNIYILPLHTDYIFGIPQVIPNERREVSLLNLAGPGIDYEDMVQGLYDEGETSLICLEGENGLNRFLILQRFSFGGGYKREYGVIAIELQEKQIMALLSGTLGADRGLAFLVNGEDEILCACDRTGEALEGLSVFASWENYIEAKGWPERSVTINEVRTEYKAWSIVTAIPQRELLSKIGWGKYAILLLSIVSILTGVAICLLYWNRNQPVLKQYMEYAEKHPDKIAGGKESANIWKNFGGVLEHMEDLNLTVQKQKQWVTDGILRKILYGAYDSGEELENEVREAGIAFPVRLPCYLAALDIEKSIFQETGTQQDTLETVFREHLDRFLPWPYRMVNMNDLNYVLFIFTGEEPVDSQEMKQLFEKMNYAIYSRIPVNIYIGISAAADTVLAVSEEYEHVCRICEYAQYYKLRIPLLLQDLPRHQHVVFSVEMEMQLENTIKKGTKEQLETLMAQISENHLDIPAAGRKQTGYIFEVLRCILLRCMDGEHSDAQSLEVLEQIHHAKTAEEIETSIWSVREYLEKDRSRQQNQEEADLKQRIEEKIAQEYSKEEFTLAIMADWLNMPEKKLYRDFKKMYGVSFASYLEMLRIGQAQHLLKEGHAVQEVAAAVGYSSDYSFRRAFKRVVGATPSDYQKMQ